MSPRKIVRGLLAALLAGAAWTGTAGLAHAGGPTSVLIVNPNGASRHWLVLHRGSLR